MELWIGGHLRSFRRCTVPNALEGYGRKCRNLPTRLPQGFCASNRPSVCGQCDPKIAKPLQAARGANGKNQNVEKDRFGETPKPAREIRALPVWRE